MAEIISAAAATDPAAGGDGESGAPPPLVGSGDSADRPAYYLTPAPAKYDRLSSAELEALIRTYMAVTLPDDHGLSVLELREYAALLNAASARGDNELFFPEYNGAWLDLMRASNTESGE
jgi:hypothetical protein